MSSWRLSTWTLRIIYSWAELARFVIQLRMQIGLDEEAVDARSHANVSWCHSFKPKEPFEIPETWNKLSEARSIPWKSYRTMCPTRQSRSMLWWLTKFGKTEIFFMVTEKTHINNKHKTANCELTLGLFFLVSLLLRIYYYLHSEIRQIRIHRTNRAALNENSWNSYSCAWIKWARRGTKHAVWPRRGDRVRCTFPTHGPMTDGCSGIADRTLAINCHSANAKKVTIERSLGDCDHSCARSSLHALPARGTSRKRIVFLLFAFNSQNA